MIGRRLSHYDVLADLGAGGMGVVYRAHDTRLDRDVAIKVLPTDRPLTQTARRRFQREAMAASALNHPNIITIYEVNSEGNTDFIVMEYVRGVTLSSVLKNRKLELSEAIRYCIQIADALTKAHAAGIVHRDLKPGNIMVTEDGLVKVLDFGLAKFDPNMATADSEMTDAERTNQFTLTQPGAVTGTVAYMSPEQARGRAGGCAHRYFFLRHRDVRNVQRPFAFHRTELDRAAAQPSFQPSARSDPVAPGCSQASGVADCANAGEENREASSDHGRGRRASCAEGLRVWWMGPLTWHPSDATIDMARAPSSWQSASQNGTYGWPSAFSCCWFWLASAAGAGSESRSMAQPAGTQEAPVEDNAYALYRRAREDLDHSDRDGSVDDAIKLLGRAVELDPQSAASYAALSDAYEYKNSFSPDPQWIKLASEYANKAVSLDNYLAAGHVSLGMAKMSAGDSTEAEKQFRAAADLDPKSAIPHRDLGLLYDKTGKGDQATEELKRALQIDPKDWKSYMAWV